MMKAAVFFGTASAYEKEWAEFQSVQGHRNGPIPAAFKTNVDIVKAHNLLNADYVLSYTGPFAALTEEEFIAQYTGLGTLPEQDVPAFEPQNAEVLEDAVDWTTRGAVNAIKNQGQCGSCWAFSTVGTLESAWQIATGTLFSLAEQQLVDCDKADNGCSGGWPHTAYDSYISGAGYCSESSYSYTASGGSCRASSCEVELPKGSVTGHENVGQSSSGLKTALSHQPVSVTVNAGQLQLYSNGVVTGSCSGQINHAVIAVGYGTDGVDYFKIRNSWGTSWGEAGYIRLGQDGGSQGTACLFQYAPVTPKLSVTPKPTPSPTPSPAPPSGAEVSFFYGMNDTLSNKFIQKDLFEVYKKFGKEVKLNMHPFVKGSISNYTCANEDFPCALEQVSMCASAVAQTHDQTSKFPGQDSSLQWHLCTAIHGDVKADTCYVAAKINKTEVEECVTNPKHVQVLLLENLLASKDVGAPPFVKVDQSPGVPQYDAIEQQLCKQHPSLSACPSPPTPPPTPPPSPAPTPTPTPGNCHAIDPRATDDWCQQNCALGFCPQDLCQCDSNLVEV